ncbi:MAG: ArnT family glycosyltransferase [Fibrobacterota bacterium]
MMFAPFSGKHLSLDSPVSVHVARQIASDPVNPPLGEFGQYLLSWNNTKMPQNSVFRATPHPPLVQIYIAPFITLFGENEILLNWLMFPFYFFSVLFFYGCTSLLKVPFRRWITVLFCIAPVVLVNSHDIMADIPLCCFTLGMFYFLFRNKNRSDIVAAGLMAAFGLLTKITAGTLVVAAFAYYLSRKRWKSLVLFLCPVFFLYGFWCLHNYLVYGTLQITSNGHMRYILGDIRYRFERMISYAGGTLVFPAVPFLLALASRSFRRPLLVIFSGASMWSLMLMIHLDYDPGSVFFYAFCSSSGLILMYAALIYLVKTKSAESNALLVHTFMQLVGGLFLTLYAARYLTPVLLPLFIGFAVILRSVDSTDLRRFVLPGTVAASLVLTVLLSVGDVIHASIPEKLSREVSRRYDPDRIRYAGRLGYLYYMDRAGMRYCLRGESPVLGEYVLHASVNPDDDYLLKSSEYTLTPVDTFTYQLFPLSTFGGRAGFYGDDRLPYSFLLGSREWVYYLFSTGNSRCGRVVNR